MSIRPRSFLRAAVDLRSIRGKLLLVVGMLLLLGGVNVIVSYWDRASATGRSPSCCTPSIVSA
jgi:hypothetical protein